MNTGEIVYLALVVASMVLFAVGLAYASWVAPGDK